ncbi:MAG TPA: pyridoxal-phosphate dependent enzyme [Pirellulaceae bacterium]|nr:pyridoxal-phosphate dependent enzyme [Pirellulaceae bacterium]HMO91592.1 pyridoxal-phosphate dependent enzyme [Pirellulaceae bacterium]HMP68289.1 pyridoxal-phosphate dependent enzyme [Pirellulaceae bacterium]
MEISSRPLVQEVDLCFYDVLRAASRIKARVHRTPVLTSESLDSLANVRLFFKCEHLQRVGAFKYRGASNAVAEIAPNLRARGVVTHSSGNHAQALALAARDHGIEAHIVMPANAPLVKREAVIGYGAHVIECEPTLRAREETAAQVQNRTGAEFIHPYNDVRVIAGQATAALELIEQVEALDIVVAPIGGGGLISGTCLTCGSQPTPIRVIGAEPAGADDAFRSKQSGALIPQVNPNTIADGLLTSLGTFTWPFIRNCVEEIVTIDDAQIAWSMKFFWQRTKQVIEASSAVAIAAAIEIGKRSNDRNLRIGVIISGGNVDLSRLPW